KIRFEKVCRTCGKTWVFEDGPKMGPRRVFCSDECKRRGHNLRFFGGEWRPKGQLKKLQLGMDLTLTLKSKPITQALPDDPWQTGQLPASVRENALYS
ncbi:MAG: hypothetical protein IIV56_07485, partial [Mailhella sp.]|nr:hypothetical protein [Mailhella sp.]